MGHRSPRSLHHDAAARRTPARTFRASPTHGHELLLRLDDCGPAAAGARPDHPLSPEFSGAKTEAPSVGTAHRSADLPAMWDDVGNSKQRRPRRAAGVREPLAGLRSPSARFRWLRARFRWLRAGFRWLRARFRWLQAGFRLLSAGFRWLRAGFRWLRARFRWLRARFRWLRAGFRWLRARFRWLRARFRWLRAGFRLLSAGFRLLSAGIRLLSAGIRSLWPDSGSWRTSLPRFRTDAGARP